MLTVVKPALNDMIQLNMDKLSVNPAKQEEAPLIADILTEATKYKVELGDQAWGNEGWTAQEVTDYMKESTAYIVKKDGEVIGTVFMQWDDQLNWGEQPPVAGYMHRLAIKDDFRGQGIGQLIIDWCEDQVGKQDRTLLRLDCDARNAELCGYYESLGFKKVGQNEVLEYGDYVAALYERPVAKDPNNSL